MLEKGKPRKRPAWKSSLARANASKRPPPLPKPARVPGKNGRPYVLPQPGSEAYTKMLDTIAGLGQIWATAKECAAVLRCSEDTFLSLTRDDQAAYDAYERGVALGKISLRRSQFALAKRNPAMAIFLGKNYLGQRDRQDLDVRVRTWDLSKLSDKDLDTLERLMRMVGWAEQEDPTGFPKMIEGRVNASR